MNSFVGKFILLPSIQFRAKMSSFCPNGSRHSLILNVDVELNGLRSSGHVFVLTFCLILAVTH